MSVKRSKPQPNKGGRPPHQPSEKDRQMVEVLAGFAVPTTKIADVLDITQPTLLKHYETELRTGAAKVEATLVGNLLRLAKGSDGTALKAITFALNCRFGWSAYVPRPETEKPLGKKEMAEADARSAHEESDWGRLIN